MKKIFFLVFALLSLVGCNKNKCNEDHITKEDFNKAIEMVETNATIKIISFVDDYKENIIEIDNNKYHCLVNYNEDLTKESYYEKKDDLLYVYEDLNGNFLRQIANDDSFIALNLNINYDLLIYSKKENCYIYKNDATTTKYYFPDVKRTPFTRSPSFPYFRFSDLGNRKLVASMQFVKFCTGCK